eukprot:GDKH01003654.1.p3 GENE.GDKH01003654.1~~GDKH01003654.1.p3  ORF type:complete len:75 (+),score=22.97 GDKH01003654.1:129-353(+)
MKRGIALLLLAGAASADISGSITLTTGATTRTTGLTNLKSAVNSGLTDKADAAIAAAESAEAEIRSTNLLAGGQ